MKLSFIKNVVGVSILAIHVCSCVPYNKYITANKKVINSIKKIKILESEKAKLEQANLKLQDSLQLVRTKFEKE